MEVHFGHHGEARLNILIFAHPYKLSTYIEQAYYSFIKVTPPLNRPFDHLYLSSKQKKLNPLIFPPKLNFERESMKMNPSKIEDCEQLALSSSSQGHELEPVRAYTCSFCKRGFLNAQALGGHMNIHRKDRARLRESSFNSSEENLLQVHEEKSNIALKRPWIFSEVEDACSPKKRDGIGELINLPLFVEKPSTNSDEERGTCVGPVSAVQELDLELRLGPEASTKDTR